MEVRLYREYDENEFHVQEYTGGEKVVKVLEDGKEITAIVKTQISLPPMQSQKSIEEKICELENSIDNLKLLQLQAMGVIA